jgi:4-amino-4-deoxy-L-arabinose transferase-like glycosyltransferase
MESQAERSYGGVSTGGRQWRLAIAVTIASALIRLGVAAFIPLFPDEAYYWQWSRHLADGYFDHPPAIAWLIRFGTLLVGDTPLGVRLGPVLAGLAVGLISCASARRIAGDRAALIAALALAVMPLSAAGLVLATPDAPLLAACAAMIYAVIRALEAPIASPRSDFWWVLAGVALGLAEASKYTAVLIPLAAFTAMLLKRELRPRLSDPGPYIAIAVSLVVFSPVVAWNAEHGWASFAFQLRHGLGHVDGSVARRELELLGGQFALVSPILFALLCLAIAKSIVWPEGRKHTRAQTALLPLVALLVFAFFMYAATKRRVEANWPAIAYIPGMLVLATHAGGRAWNRWLKGGLVLTGALSCAVYVNTLVPILPIPAHRDPVARAAGWDDLAFAVQRELAVPSGRAWVAAERYQEASMLSFNLVGQPPTFALNLTTRTNQYDLWPGFADVAHRGDAIVLVTDEAADGSRHPGVALLSPYFTSVRRGAKVVLARRGDPVKPLRIWVLSGWRGSWPGSDSLMDSKLVSF